MKVIRVPSLKLRLPSIALLSSGAAMVVAVAALRPDNSSSQYLGEPPPGFFAYHLPQVTMLPVEVTVCAFGRIGCFNVVPQIYGENCGPQGAGPVAAHIWMDDNPVMARFFKPVSSRCVLHLNYRYAPWPLHGDYVVKYGVSGWDVDDANFPEGVGDTKASLSEAVSDAFSIGTFVDAAFVAGNAKNYAGLNDAVAIQLGAVPDRVLSHGAGGIVMDGKIYNPWGGQILLAPGDEKTNLDMTYTNVPHSRCEQFSDAILQIDPNVIIWIGQRAALGVATTDATNHADCSRQTTSTSITFQWPIGQVFADVLTGF